MDVRCEKCQTEYELDEARLKPGGVTVKCTNCGHMFKIRKRSNTNVGAPASASSGSVSAAIDPRNKPPSKPAATHPAQPQQTAAGPGHMRPDSMLDDAPTKLNDGEGPTTERQWLIRLENGEQKSCRELATLQQWIIAGTVTRESLISRTGKTWKRLGDIPELKQYFEIADEARTTKDTRKQSPSKPPVSTMLGVGGAPMAAGGTILPDDEQQTIRRGSTTPPPVPRVTKTPPHGAPNTPTPAAATPPPAAPTPARRPITQPPPPPPKKESSIPAPAGNRATAAWASDQIKPEGIRADGPFGGKISAIPDEPAFAGRVRAAPSSEASFDTDRVKLPSREDDDDVLPRRKGSSAGLWILLVVLLVGAGTTAALYFFVFKKDEPVAKAPADAAVVATVDAAPVVTPVIDAPVAPPVSPVEAAHHELWSDNEARMQTAYDGLAGKEEPDALAVRSQLGTAIAQAMLDRAGLVGDKSEADKLRKQSKTIVLEAATMAQKAHKALPDDASTNVAYAAVLRLQGKPAKDVRRFLEVAKTKPGDWSRDVALGEALLLAREGKLDDAKTAFAAIDTGDGKLETSNDVRARFHVALLAFAQNKPADAKPLVDQVLAAQPDHAGAKALAAKLENLVAKTDPLPPEDPGKGSGSGSATVAVGSGSGSASKPPDGGNTGGGKDDYDGYVKKADAIADSNCTKANELYGKALEIKPNGVEALTGQGYCALEAKNFSTAHRKFSTALATSARYEPALAGIAETYTLQNRKEDAIAAWKRYLDAYPGSAKGQKALERLGAGAGTPTPPNPGSGSATPGSDAPPPPPPPPTPTPAPAGSGSG